MLKKLILAILCSFLIVAPAYAAGIPRNNVTGPLDIVKSSWQTCAIVMRIDYQTQVTWYRNSSIAIPSTVAWRTSTNTGLAPDRVWYAQVNYGGNNGSYIGPLQKVTPGYSGSFTAAADFYVNRPAWAIVKLYNSVRTRLCTSTTASSG